MRWLIVFALSCVVFNSLHRWLEKIGLGNIPGDFSVKIGARRWHFPFGSSVLLTLIGLALARWL